MGIKKWLARKGAVGGTARWAGNGYLQIKLRSPNAAIEDVMKELVAIRYRGDSLSTARQALVETINRGDMTGLAHLVTNILSIEASYQENSTENRFLFLDVIQEELEKLGIPSTQIYDSSRKKFD